MILFKKILAYLFLFIVLPIGVAFLLSITNNFFNDIATVIFGSVIVCIVVAIVVFSLRTFLKDVVKTKREAELLDLIVSQEKFISLYEHSPIPYITIDHHGSIMTYNLAAVRLLETTTEELYRKQFSSFLYSENTAVLEEVVQKLRETIAFKDREIQITTERGSTRWVSLSVFVYKSGLERLISLVDITHQKEIDTAKSEFVALATHQLRTPVAAIRWNIELLRKKISNQDEGIQKYAQKIEANTMRMIALINDFLNVSKLEMGTFATEFSNINLKSFFESIADEHIGSIVSKKIDFKTFYNPETFTIKCDERLLHIIVSNLLSNAVKYVPSEKSVTLGYTVKGASVIITVADTGIGIPEHEQDKLFSKFFRASNAREEKAEGTGLGLYVVQQSVEKLGGTITMQSRENEGTEFTIVLPRR